MALVVMTGGIRSGKSAAAQNLAMSLPDDSPVVVAAFGRASDTEMGERIRRHAGDRPEHFTTLEASDPQRWLDEVDDDEVLVVDCIGTLLGMLMERSWAALGACLEDADADEVPEGLAEQIGQDFDDVVGRIVARPGDTIVVTNEVGMSLVPLWASGRLFADLLGRANRRLVAGADAAFLVIAGRLVSLSALPVETPWPKD